MNLARIDTFAVRIPRDTVAGKGGAGSPAGLKSAGRYALAESYGTVYARDLETLRLAARLMDVHTESFADGACLVELADISDALTCVVSEGTRPYS